MKKFFKILLKIQIIKLLKGYYNRNGGYNIKSLMYDAQELYIWITKS